MFKKFSERFPSAAKSLESIAGGVVPATTTTSDDGATTSSTTPVIDGSNDDATDADSNNRSNSINDDDDDDNNNNSTNEHDAPRKSDTNDRRLAHMKAALADKINSESVSAAASIAATSMLGFMKKAQSAASVAASAGAAKATVWKNKALDAADMDALQRRLSYALDRSTGDVNLELLNWSFVTDNIVAMGFPSMNLGQNRTLLHDNPIDLVAMYLNDKHAGHYMIWNLSEETYDYAYFDNQVLEFNFPGHPAPPLGLVFKICSSIENWLSADDLNIAAIHCLTGKGRTGTVIACYLAWTGQFPTAMEALEFVAEQRDTTVEKLTIPSQRRYIQYFTNVIDGVKPRSSPLLLRRVIINTIPVFGTRRKLEPVKKATAIEAETTSIDATTGDVESEEGDSSRGVAAHESSVSFDAAAATEATDDAAATTEMQEIIEDGCCPYLQIFKGGKLVFTTTWRDMESGNGVQWASVDDGCVSFPVDCMLQGDVLIRCRHLTDAGERISMFRGAFHTGYIPQGILRLTKAQLDGACSDDRFDRDFFVDLIFADVETDSSATQTTGDNATTAAAPPQPKSEGVALTEEDRQAYEDMLHRDEAFWVDIEARKVRLQQQREAQAVKRQQAAAAAKAAAADAAAAAAANALAEQMELEQQQKQQQAAAARSSFSIVGNDDDDDAGAKRTTKRVSSTTVRKSSWDDAKDQELMSELESLTNGALAKAADDLEEKAAETTTSSNDGAIAGLAKEFEDMKKLEQELGLESFASEFATDADGDTDKLLDGARLDALDAELEGLGALGTTAKTPSDARGDDVDVMNFAADDFDELEEYLSGLSTPSTTTTS